MDERTSLHRLIEGPSRIWQVGDFTLCYYRQDDCWGFHGRNYGTSGYRTPIGAFIGWVRWYRKAERYHRKAHRMERR